jgi:hypothetical protein
MFEDEIIDEMMIHQELVIAIIENIWFYHLYEQFGNNSKLFIGLSRLFNNTDVES